MEGASFREAVSWGQFPGGNSPGAILLVPYFKIILLTLPVFKKGKRVTLNDLHICNSHSVYIKWVCHNLYVLMYHVGKCRSPMRSF